MAEAPVSSVRDCVNNIQNRLAFIGLGVNRGTHFNQQFYRLFLIFGGCFVERRVTSFVLLIDVRSVLQQEPDQIEFGESARFIDSVVVAWVPARTTVHGTV